MIIALLLFITLTFSSRVTLEEIYVPNQWKSTGVAKDQPFTLTFALTQKNLNLLEKTVLDVSDPESLKYGQHLSLDEVNELIRPYPHTIPKIIGWLKKNNITPDCSLPTPDFLRCKMRLAQANELLKAKYETFVHDEGRKLIRTRKYSIPDYLKHHIDFISPTIRLFNNQHKLFFDTDNNNVGLAPSKIRSLYNIGDNVGSASGNKQAVTGFLKQYFKQSDQDEFYNTLYKGGKGTTITVKGDATQGFKSGVESMLDTEYVTVTGTNITTEFWSYKGHAPDNRQNEPFLDWLLDAGNTTDAVIPKIFSTSYGEDESSVSESYASRINIEFQKLGARGVSILFASGDSGANCKDEKFEPTFPGASPWVTSVGATTLSYGANDQESAASFSSGGFSNRYSTPSWQKTAVESFFANPKCPDTKYFNNTGRGFPDISAAGTGFTVVANRIPMPGVSGTSCSSPTVGGVIGLLNDVRMLQGKSSLGFLNPLLYSKPTVLHDITTGTSSGCAYEDGYPAVSGWDPVTGLGTPNFVQMQLLATSLP